MAPSDYFADYEGSGYVQPLPSPGETPYQTPPTSMSRRSSGRGTSSPPLSSSPPPPLPEDTKRNSRDSATDENISILDPRRFTPTLHASLVSEILSLRRDLEGKHKYIEDLESTLHSSKSENETLSRKLSQSNKEGRSVKRQFQQLENGTLAALEELARDRDEWKGTSDDLKEKVEKLERKIKSQEDEAERTQRLWDRDRETWDNQKRTLERKVHVSESRLKNVLAELAAEHAAEQEHHNDAGKLGGLSLAEELDFDGEDEEVLDEIDEDEEEDFPEHEVHARRALSSRSSFEADFKAKRVLGLAQDGKQLPTVSETGSLHTTALQSPDSESFTGRPSDLSRTDSIKVMHRRNRSSEVPVEYVDSGVQYSPPPSPQLASVRAESAGTFYDDMTDITDSAVNSRVQSLASPTPTSPTPTPYDAEAMTITQERPAVIMVSAAAQTTDEPLSPPETPKVSQQPTFDPMEDTPGPSRTSADREAEEEPKPEPEPEAEMFTNKPAPVTIPSIAIHPASAPPSPPSPRETMLPPGTKNVSTQTKTEELVSTRSISIQTDEIRIDRRLMKLPPHLLPSAIKSTPASPEVSLPGRYGTPEQGDDELDGVSIPTATPKQLSEKALGKSPLLRSDIPSSPPQPMVMSDTDTEDRYPGNNDNGPLQPGNREQGIRRPFRKASLFAGFEDDNNDEKQGDADDEDIPDIQSAPSAETEGGQPTVVDAIAATMVGEWMWKYVRRRKSFNAHEAPEDLSRTAQDGSINVTGNGVRHKRWVWISPYERSVMWSSKQPASGTALLGKSGRKLLIQSVLDVKDDTPLPRGSGIQPFNRSILILTPARALKFTAISQERHYLWLTALSFLAHASVGAPELAAIPPVPQGEPEPSSSSAFSRRTPIRDSVRLTKDKQRPSALSSLTSRDSNSRKGAMLSPTIHTEGPLPNAADAPSIPRYTNHARKRRRTSEATNASARTQYVDHVGTVRMEAFVASRRSNDTSTTGSVMAPSRMRAGFGIGTRARGNTQWSSSTGDPRRSGMIVMDEFDAFDPFKGF
ncbi:hypothetical protein NA57DRAFT_35590 [Rhizodiscina lignyota]|uniref:Pleckstrin homology domain-containing protein n=1 Tax=Rhizodiscina lignyota TaxID=1504668 RepID=A0A9P4IIB1_9PEZI|nr:hypothetical protein NA57DRAFT_35590 [Rhizodiscina lignyota]